MGGTQGLYTGGNWYLVGEGRRLVRISWILLCTALPSLVDSHLELMALSSHPGTGVASAPPFLRPLLH